MIKISKKEAFDAFVKDSGWDSKGWEEAGHARFILVGKHLDEEAKKLRELVLDMDKSGNYFLRKKRPGEKTAKAYGPACLGAKPTLC